MKLPHIFLGLVVWLAGVSVAYYVGARLNPEEVVETEIPQAPVASVPKTEEPADAPTAPLAGPSVSSLMEMSMDDLSEALRQADDLSDEDRRALLAEAFALPSNDFRRSRMIRKLLDQIAETSPHDALAMANDIGSLREAERARISILEVWASNDPAAALSWAGSALANEAARSRSEQMLAIYRGYAEQNPRSLR